MAETGNKSAEPTRIPGRTQEVTVEGRVAGELPPAKHGDPAENLAPNESVISVKTGSEATVESGTDPVLPLQPGGGVSEFTRVKNKDLRERDEKEREKRGPEGGTFSVSVSFPGLMMAVVDGTEIVRSGSYTGNFQEKFELRPLTEEELEEHVPSAAPADKQAVNRRQQDLIKGAGQGGGGNPMKAGEARGTTSGVTQPAGGAATTSGPGAGRVTTSRGPTK